MTSGYSNRPLLSEDGLVLVEEVEEWGKESVGASEWWV
jgi:hypothetical protein